MNEDLRRALEDAMKGYQRRQQNQLAEEYAKFGFLEDFYHLAQTVIIPSMESLGDWLLEKRHRAYVRDLLTTQSSVFLECFPHGQQRGRNLGFVALPKVEKVKFQGETENQVFLLDGLTREVVEATLMKELTFIFECL